MSPARRTSSSVGSPSLAERLRVALVLERELQERLVQEPALLACDLEDEHVMGVVVHGEALRASRRVVGVGLHRQPDRVLELPAEDGQRKPVDVQRLQDDGRAGLPLGEDAGDVGGLRERAAATGRPRCRRRRRAARPRGRAGRPGTGSRWSRPAARRRPRRGGRRTAPARSSGRRAAAAPSAPRRSRPR